MTEHLNRMFTIQFRFLSHLDLRFSFNLNLFVLFFCCYSLIQVNEDLLASGSVETRTIVLMRRLFDNYELDTHTVEQVTAEEEQEEVDFLKAVLATPVMQKTMKFLEFKGE